MSSQPPSTSNELITSAQASKIYFLPNLMTAGNLFCGFVAIIRCIQARFAPMMGEISSSELYTEAVWFIFAAVVFDSLDGRLARMGGKESLFGREFDSIADIVSFGVAPALMVFFLVLSPDQSSVFRPVGWFFGFIYLLCAGVRLARFNVITHPLIQTLHHKNATKDFIGLPVPAAAGMIVSLVLLMTRYDLERWAIILPGLMLLIAYLMVSSIRYPSFKEIDWRTKTRFRTFVFIPILIALIYLFKQFALVLLFFSYLFFGIFRHIGYVRKRATKLRKYRLARAARVNNSRESSE
ncbi:MAG: CDP-diacylglycerol--serine O-phosphatidyltransferase [Opitutaceae bacterium]|nr:CDP-diacylglycerol--serine O-phosphatidyltransferase [Opitutaceae bacterium]